MVGKPEVAIEDIEVEVVALDNLEASKRCHLDLRLVQVGMKVANHFG